MFKEFYEKYYFMYSFVGICGLGLFFRMIINLVYKKLVKETDNVGNTKNKSLKHMKLKFETCYKLKIGVHNVDTFVDKNIMKYRFCGLLLSTWENFCGQVLFANLLIVPIYAVFGVYFQCGQDVILLTGAVGIATSAILIIVDKSINLSIKKNTIQLNLLDFLDNFLKVRLEQETFHPEHLEQYRKEYFAGNEIDGNKVDTSAVASLSQGKDELNRRREAKKKKEEEKRLNAQKREEELRKLEEIRVEEEKRKIEERKQIVTKRREEEILKLEEEREALEIRRAETKKRAEAKRRDSEKKQQTQEEKDRLVKGLELEEKSVVEREEVERLLQAMSEIAAEREKDIDNSLDGGYEHNQIAGLKDKKLSEQESKLIEDVLKEFFS